MRGSSLERDSNNMYNTIIYLIQFLELTAVLNVTQFNATFVVIE